MVDGEKIISGPKYIHYDGNKFAELVKKYPKYAKELRQLVNDSLDEYRENPFREGVRVLKLEKINNSIDFINPNYEEIIKQAAASLKKETVTPDSEIYNIFSPEGQAKQFYKDQPYFYDNVKTFHLWNKEDKFWEKEG